MATKILRVTHWLLVVIGIPRFRSGCFFWGETTMATKILRVTTFPLWIIVVIGLPRFARDVLITVPRFSGTLMPCMKTIAVIAVFLLAVSASAQTRSTPSAPSPAPQTSAEQSVNAASQARPGDVDTLEHILAALYDAISGRPGPRDWNRVRSLFAPGARLIPTFRDPNGKVGVRNLSVDEYMQRSQPFFDKEGFFETPVANRIEQWDRIAHVWSTYESRHAKGEKPFARGINSFQLLNDGQRWWVVTIYWEGEEPAHPLPDKYLK